MVNRSSVRLLRMRELLLGVEGLALLRGLYDGSPEESDARIAEITGILADDTLAEGDPTAESDATTGYRLWSSHYDEPGNQLIAIEQPAVWSLLEGIPAGEALDAACGTGRHTRHLVGLGHRVTGVDLTAEMLDIVRRAVPEARFSTADLLALPLGADRFDLVVCGLAIAHIQDLRAGIAELARVLRPGGRMLLSAVHPFQAHLGWHATFKDADGNRGFVREYPHSHATFKDADGNRGFVREYPHSHADYIAAFTAAGLTVRGCVEPSLGLDEVSIKKRAFERVPAATVAAYLGLPAVLVWDVERTR